MNYSKIRKYDVANGDGIACTLFVCGCYCGCKGCFQKELWDFNAGETFTKEIEDYFIQCCNNPHVSHVSLLGGDFIQQDISVTLPLLKRIQSECGKPVWVWTGLTYEELNKDQRKLLPYIDILVDGRFVEELRDLKLKYRGSSNQRVIKVKETLEKGEIVQYI